MNQDRKIVIPPGTEEAHTYPRTMETKIIWMGLC